MTGGFYVHQWEHDIVILMSEARRNLNLDIKIPRCAPKEHEESGGCHRERSKAVFCQPRDCFSRFAPSQ